MLKTIKKQTRSSDISNVGIKAADIIPKYLAHKDVCRNIQGGNLLCVLITISQHLTHIVS
jgi:hypothetical protein